LTVSDTLRQRLRTAGVLIPVTALAVLLLPTSVLALVLLAVVGAAAWEWAGLAGLITASARMVYAVATCLAIALGWLYGPASGLGLLLGAAVLWWAAIALVLFRIRVIKPAIRRDLVLLPVGTVLLGSTWAAIIGLHGIDGPDGRLLVGFLVVLTGLADTGAYFAGRRFGRRKLAPVLSPGKTVEGMLGGLAAGTCWGLVLAWLLGLSVDETLLLIAVCILAVFLSVVGDLYESLLKRRRGLKDAGSLLPGHGGVLDRIDSMTAAAPVFVLGFLWLEGFL
jgi:phosphatidate cytidylyltransferase